MKLRCIELVVLAILAGGCRWRDYEPIVEPAAQALEPAAVFENVIDKARTLGYRSEEIDSPRRFATFIARYGNYEMQGIVGNAVAFGPNANHFMVKVTDDGKVRVWATGPDVRGDRIDRFLLDELGDFAARVAGYEVVYE